MICARTHANGETCRCTVVVQYNRGGCFLERHVPVLHAEALSENKESRTNIKKFSTTKKAKMPKKEIENSLPIEPVLQTLIQLFIENIDNISSNHADHNVIDAIQSSIRKLRATSKTTRSIVLADKRLKYYEFFFATLTLKTKNPIRFLDGVNGVSLFEGSFGNGPNRSEFAGLTSTMVINDRLKTAKLLAGYEPDEIERRSAKYMPTDMPIGISPMVAVFVGRARFMTQLSAERHPTQVTRCNLCTCRHKFIYQTTTGAQPQRFSVPDDDDGDSDDDDDAHEESTYWRMLSPRTIHTLPTRSFCSKSCAMKYEREVADAVPVDVFDAERHEIGISNSKVGVLRLLAATRASFRRNDAAARALRDSMRSLRKLESRTVSLTDIAKIHQNIIDVFNIDLALQYAAASLSDTSIRFLPGQSANWRSKTSKQQTRSIERVKSIYLKHYNIRDSIARDERFPPRWLQKVKEQATVIFPA